MLGGIPNVFVSTTDLQSIAFKGAPVITAVAVKGSPTHPADGLKTVSRADARTGSHPAAQVREADDHASCRCCCGSSPVASSGRSSICQRSSGRATSPSSKRSASRTHGCCPGSCSKQSCCRRSSAAAAILMARLLAPAMSVPVAFPAAILVLVPVTAVRRVRSREPRRRSPCRAGRSSTGVRMRDVRCPT